MKALTPICSVCLVLIMWTAHTQAEAQREAIPIIEIEMLTHDFGQVLEGELVRHDFRVFNRGNAALEIKNVKPD